MPVCPRCRHPLREIPSICSQCGYEVRQEGTGPPRRPAAYSPLKSILVIAALLLVIGLITLACVYVEEASRLGR